MRNTSVCLVTILAISIFGCSKSGNKPIVINTNSVRISLVSGDNQSAQAGYYLADSIVVKVTNASNGNAVSGYNVQFIQSGCSDDLAVTKTTKSDGTAVYYWALASNTGTQTLRAVSIAGDKTRDDSLAVTATGQSFGKAFKSACTPQYTASSIANLSTGRLLASFNGTASIRYSDDNGISWQPLTSFGATHTVEMLAVSAKDEILAATTDAGLFYSKDAGSTWANITPPAFNKQHYISGLTFTNSGNIIFCGQGPDYYISTDKGNTWTAEQSGLTANIGYDYPVQLNNGDLYVLSYTNILFKSTDGGKTFIALPNAQNVHITGICTDAAGGFYKAWNDQSSSVTPIVVSDDNGATFQNVYVFTNPGNQPYVDGLEILNGHVFFDELGFQINQVLNSTTLTNLATNNLPLVSYTLNSQGNLVYAKIDGIYY